MAFRSFLKKYFQFSKKERNGLLLLTFLMLILMVIGYIIKHKKENVSIEISSLHIEMNDTLVSSPRSETGKKKKEFTRFAFDPNDISESEAILLGFSKKTAAVLLNFRSKGGKFKSKEDLKKIYGVSPKLYAQLEDYIIIKSEIYSQNSNLKSQHLSLSSSVKNKLNLNAADSSQLVELKGIGPALSRRILRYRNSLGGFYSVDQLAEVFGISDSLLFQLKTTVSIDTLSIKKININESSLDEIKQHPYFKYIIAQSIIKYRKQHGPFKTAEELKQIGSISDDMLQKIKPYISY